MINYLRKALGSVTFSFVGGFEDDFLDDCFCNNIPLRNIRYENGVLFAECIPSVYRVIHTIAHKNGGKVRLTKKQGIVFLVDKLLCRKGLARGFVFGIVLCCYLLSFVWQIDYVGNTKISNETLSDFVSSQGLNTSVRWSRIDTDYIEDMLMASFDEIAWVHINKQGTTISVEIQEATPKPVITDKAPTNLKAKKDGVIKFARVYDGWQEKVVGEGAVKGDILVSGIYESENSKENMYAHASGEFIAQVRESFSLTVSREQKYKSYSSPKCKKAISFFGLYIPLYFGRVPTQNADVSKRVEYITINDKSIPIGLINYDISPYVIESRELNDSELTKLIQKEIDNQLNNLYSKENIVSNEIIISLYSNNAIASGKVEVLENIGEEIKLFSDNNIE